MRSASVDQLRASKSRARREVSPQRLPLISDAFGRLDAVTRQATEPSFTAAPCPRPAARVPCLERCAAYLTGSGQPCLGIGLSRRVALALAEDVPALRTATDRARPLRREGIGADHACPVEGRPDPSRFVLGLARIGTGEPDRASSPRLRDRTVAHGATNVNTSGMSHRFSPHLPCTFFQERHLLIIHWRTEGRICKFLRTSHSKN
jgi:hypothetical protein